MLPPLHNLILQHTSQRKLETLVENRHVYGHDKAELSIYETFDVANAVGLQFDNPVIISMLSGKKVMHFEGRSPMEFLPQETIVLPSEAGMSIDFPEATIHTPTRCLTLMLSNDLVKESLHNFDNAHQSLDTSLVSDFPFALLRQDVIMQNVERLVHLFLESNQPAKPLFIDFTLRELTIRILQTEAKRILLESAQSNPHAHRLAFVSNYIQQNIYNNIDVENLHRIAHMSKASFYRYFKATFGMSPVHYILQEKLKLAKLLLRTTSRSVTEICYDLSFGSVHYFDKVFKKWVGMSPSDFKKKAQ